jgi:cleavage and polyadenylation specificity factor subunit 1
MDHACGLNPRAYRAVESEGFGSRGVIDGGLLIKGWAGLGARRRAEACGKVGVEAWILRNDLEIITKVQAL